MAALAKEMKKYSTQEELVELHRFVNSLGGLYSRVGRRLKVDRSYVSRVARGQRRSDEIERALLSEFQRIVNGRHKE